MKKILMIMLITTLALALIPAVGLAESTLRVQGNASITVTPDTALLNVGYAGEDSDSSLAQQQAADTITAIVEALKVMGIAEEDISTASLNTYPVYNYTDDTQTLRGYRVEHMLAVTVNDLDSVGDALDAALQAGANQSNSIVYRSSREKDVYLQALALAVENASSKADALAVASGVWLGRLNEINEVTSYNAYTYAQEARYDKGTGASIGSTIMAGDLEITASVELVYETR